MVSSSKEKLNATRNSPPKKRPPKYPHLPEKIEQIIEYFPLTQKQIYERTRIPQASISKCLGRKGSLAAASLSALSTKLPQPIPMSWLTSGPEGGSLADVLSKEKAPTPPPQEDVPAPTREDAAFSQKIKKIDTLYPEWKPLVDRYVDLVIETADRHTIAVPAKKRQSRAVPENGE